MSSDKHGFMCGLITLLTLAIGSTITARMYENHRTAARSTPASEITVPLQPSTQIPPEERTFEYHQRFIAQYEAAATLSTGTCVLGMVDEAIVNDLETLLARCTPAMQNAIKTIYCIPQHAFSDDDTRAHAHINDKTLCLQPNFNDEEFIHEGTHALAKEKIQQQYDWFMIACTNGFMYGKNLGKPLMHGLSVQWSNGLQGTREGIAWAYGANNIREDIATFTAETYYLHWHSCLVRQQQARLPYLAAADRNDSRYTTKTNWLFTNEFITPEIHATCMSQLSPVQQISLH